MRGRDTSGSPAADATNAAIDVAQQVLTTNIISLDTALGLMYHWCHTHNAVAGNIIRCINAHCRQQSYSVTFSGHFVIVGHALLLSADVNKFCDQQEA